MLLHRFSDRPRQHHPLDLIVKAIVSRGVV
jgi:hypothetical protein